MVRDVFRLAKENAPSIIFIDEVDAIATARFDAQTGQAGTCRVGEGGVLQSTRASRVRQDSWTSPDGVYKL